MDFKKLLLFLFICASLIISVMLSLKSFTGYIVSDIADTNANLLAFLFLAIGIVGTWIYIHNFKSLKK